MRQWLLANAGTQVRSLIQEDPISLRTTKPAATTTEPVCLEPVLHDKRSQR